MSLADISLMQGRNHVLNIGGDQFIYIGYIYARCFNWLTHTQ